MLGYEGYSDHAIIPVPGDKPTIGFGSTKGVKMGQTITPPAAIARSYRDVQKYEGAIKSCVHVPLYQREYDAYVDLAYNIGPYKFCHSTLVVDLNRQDYSGACRQILKFDKFHGRVIKGLTVRRIGEFEKCIGEDKPS